MRGMVRTGNPNRLSGDRVKTYQSLSGQSRQRDRKEGTKPT